MGTLRSNVSQLSWIMFGLLIFFAGMLFGAWLTVPTQEGDRGEAHPCPTEDSCVVDHVDPDGPGPEGEWQVRRVVP